MKKSNFFTKDIIFWIIILVFLFGGKFLLPKSGNLALLTETFEVLFVLMMLGYIICKSIYTIKNNPNSKKGFIILIIILCLGISFFISKNLVLDIISGPCEIRLYNYKTTQLASGRILDFHYYIEGDDDSGKRYMMEISGDDANRIAAKNNRYVTVIYYENTERVVSIN